MRNPVATPASIILMTLILGFFVFVAFSYLTTSKTMYVLEQGRWTYIWERAFVLFTDSFFALQCAGALLAYSLFLGAPSFFERKTLFRYLSSVVVSLIVLTALYVACNEGFLPTVKRQMRETRSLGLFSDALYEAARDKARAGDPVSALEYVRISLLSDGRNQNKLSLKSALLSQLTDAQYDEYLARTTGADPREDFDETAALARAQTALQKRNFPDALAWAQAVLAVQQSNKEALRIAGIAADQISGPNAALQTEIARVLYARKKEAAAALEAGRQGSGRDLVRAYYLLADMRRRFPFDANVAEYFREAGDLLPGVSFFTDDAELALSFRGLADETVVFWNPLAGGGREIVSIGEMVAAGDKTYYKNIEVAGFGPAAGGSRLLYHYLAPLGKRIGSSINLTGLDKTDPAKRTVVRVLSGRPAWDPDNGIKLNVAPADLHTFTLSRTDMESRGLGELLSFVRPLKNPPFFAGYARMDDLIVREIVLHVVRPFFLLILTLLCFCIGLTQRARYHSSVSKGAYVWVLVIPLVMLAIMEVMLWLYRMGAVFLYYALGQVLGIAVIAVLHVFFLLFALLRFGGKIGASLRR
ncbi:MAG: hypothetical protein JXD23_10535 [Spirochaetales bacterium]|nr:hypothetical protein [Spirochaetales bacterium]